MGLDEGVHSASAVFIELQNALTSPEDIFCCFNLPLTDDKLYHRKRTYRPLFALN